MLWDNNKKIRFFGKKGRKIHLKEKSRTEEFLNKVYENAEMCCESISMITEKVEDPSLLSELQSEHRDYTDLSGEAVNLLAKENKLPKEKGPLAQFGVWSGIQMNTAFDKSPDKIAEMMMQGSMMGVIDMSRTLKEYGDTPEDCRKLGENLIKNRVVLRLARFRLKTLKISLAPKRPRNRRLGLFKRPFLLT